MISEITDGRYGTTQMVDHHFMTGVRRTISIGVLLNLSIPTDTGYIEPLVENKDSAKQQRIGKTVLL